MKNCSQFSNYGLQQSASCSKHPDFEVDQLTKVEVTFVAFDPIDRSTEEQLEAIEGAVLHLARANTSLRSSRS